MTEGELLGKRLTPDYNCAHFLCEAWEHLLGQDITPFLGGFLAGVGERRALPAIMHGFVRVHQPVEPCVVLFRRVKAAPHVGLYLRGRVLHLTGSGPMRQRLHMARLGYTSVRYYAAR